MATLTQRSQDEILDRMNDRKDGDPLGFETGEYIDYLDFENAKAYLKEGVTAEEWAEACSDTKPPLEKIKSYMPFAFGKAHGERGISANRSIQHMIAWAWLSGDDELLGKIESEYDHSYSAYGLPILRMICEHCGWDAKELGDC